MTGAAIKEEITAADTIDNRFMRCSLCFLIGRFNNVVAL
jgi:hypothetical protein